MKAEGAERGLLFGVLAFQNDFITRDQLLGTVRLWSSDTSAGLDELLVEQGALSEDDRRFLNGLVDRYVARYQGDVTQSLQRLSSVGSVKDDLAKVTAPQLQATLDLVATLPRSGEPLANAQQIGAATGSGLRFRIRRLLDRGGLGVVSVALDSELNRDVALKQIRTDRADDAIYRSKFVLEAEITGGLEHPGIVPVYGLGLDESGRPYYAMRLIRGDNLGIRIKAFHDERKSTQLAYDGMPLRRLLRRFLDVCDALAYAHARGVLHRDLKPGNVMLGKHGETLVVEWGLAKATGVKRVAGEEDAEERAADEEPLLQPSGSQQHPTTYGSVLGTAVYAPPEQLTGDIDQLGIASDVYGLGAIFYELLTGAPPASGKTLDEVIEQVTQGRIPRPRSVVPGIPRALEAICLRALAIRPEDRYPDAAALRREVERWLDDQRIEALPDRPWHAVMRWLRRHRDVAATGLVGLIALALVSIAAALLIDRARRRAETLADEKAQLAELEFDARQQAEEQRNEAQRRRAESEAVTEFLKRSFRRVDPERGSRTITVAETLDDARASANEEFAETPLLKSAVLDALATAYYGIGEYRAARDLYQETLDLDEQRVGPGDRDTLAARNGLATSLYQLGEYEQAIQLLRKNRELAADKMEPSELNNLAEMEVTQGNLEAAESLFREAAQKIAAEPEPDHGLQAVIDLNLARVILVRGDGEQAVLQFQKAHSRLCEVYSEEHPKALLAASNLAVALARIGREKESMELAERVITIKDRVLGESHPDTLASKHNLAMSHLRQKNFEPAIPLLEQVYAGLPSFAEPNDRRLIGTAELLADLYYSKGQDDKALPKLQAVLKTYDEFAMAPDATYAKAVNLSSRCLIAKGKSKEVLAKLAEAIPEISTALGEDAVIPLRLRLTLAAARRELGETAESIAVIEQVAKIAEGQPAAVEIRWQANMERGETWVRADDLVRAREAFQAAQQILDEYAETLPDMEKKRSQTAAAIQQAGAVVPDP